MKGFRQHWVCLAGFAFVFATGCAWGTMTPEEFEGRQVNGVCGEFFQPNGLVPTFAAIANEIGRPIRATKVAIHADYAVLELRDPMNPVHLNQWVVRGVDVEAPTPQPVRADEELDARTFRVADFPWSDLNDALDRGLSSLNLESGTVRYLVLETHDGRLRMRAYYNGPRDSGHVDFDGELAILDARRN
ncbi:MAG: hypothetical protein ACJAYU_001206 [Bradymonadia bacterium]|jgi:hypothetical protein